MRALCSKFLLLGLLPAAALVAQAPNAAPAAKPISIHAVVDSASESRNPNSGSLNLNFLLFTENVPKGTLLYRFTPTRVVDDLGRAVPLASATGLYNRIRIGFLSEVRTANPMFPASLNLTAPLRTATTLTVEGTAELFLPTESNGAMLRLPNFGLHEGRIESPALSRLGIVLRRLTAETWPQYDGARYFPNTPDFDQTLVLHVEDPKGLVVGIQLQDRHGSPVPLRTTSSGANVHLLTLDGPPAPDAQLVLTLAVPEALVTVPFRIEKVPLP